MRQLDIWPSDTFGFARTPPKDVYNAKRQIAPGADSIPKSSQAVRSAPADLTPMRFTWIPRADVNEPGTIVPRRCDGRPKDQRICPQAEPT